MAYETISFTIENNIALVKLNRPEKANALNAVAWKELKSIFEELDENAEVRVIVLSGAGKHFCSGIDISMLAEVTRSEETCDTRKREKLRKKILELQASVTAIEQCSKPVIAAIKGGCIGAGVDIICACDMRYATQDAFFTVKEIDMGMVADLGTLQRLPKLIPDGFAREMAFTGREVFGAEAERIGLINKCYETVDNLFNSVTEIAASIASKSPVSIRGTKHILNHSRDHSVADGLQYMATWNAAMLLSEDLNESFKSKSEKRLSDFRN
ncbi:crotonase/enoyl-CoA hydratase family protein [Dyadobacter frigoris]|uniref:Crotonase/enoyl-CoA hydratase family protein n=1 Tax=Dyadobacter frigoris TaxID=2576211 RepID=A0A4U6D8N7_9BACT|nr:crotonase/enoyl-CoA hydratase family protein [Dyadobacter frigoris]TKT93126.1 crotonase/enoyl-CoA hydratase family protein [Dyadobacter frigoris]GLU56001.1 enoyl-CoA hydratase [Dyadobacter frigoris]